MSALYGRAPAIRLSCRGVKAGLGISILPYFLVRQDIREGELAEFRIKDLALNRKYSVIYHKNKFLPRSARTLMELCKEGNGQTESENYFRSAVFRPETFFMVMVPRPRATRPSFQNI